MIRLKDSNREVSKQDRHLILRVVLVTCVCLVLIEGMLALLMAPYWFNSCQWYRQVADVKVTYRGRPTRDWRVYRARDGSVIILRTVSIQKGSDQVYILDGGSLLSPNLNAILVFPGWVYHRTYPCHGKPVCKAIFDFEPRLVVGNGFIEFSEPYKGGGRVRIEMPTQ